MPGDRKVLTDSHSSRNRLISLRTLLNKCFTQFLQIPHPSATSIISITRLQIVVAVFIAPPFHPDTKTPRRPCGFKDADAASPHQRSDTLTLQPLNALTLPPTSPNVDSNLTLSNLSNYLSPTAFHVHPLANFDTLSVYRGSLCDQLGRASTTRSANLQRLSQHEKSNNPEIQVSRSRKNIEMDPFHSQLTQLT